MDNSTIHKNKIVIIDSPSVVKSAIEKLGIVFSH